MARRSVPAKQKKIRSDLFKYTAKICAFIDVGKLDDAQQWARVLQEKLIELNLLVDNRPKR